MFKMGLGFIGMIVVSLLGIGGNELQTTVNDLENDLMVIIEDYENADDNAALNDILPKEEELMIEIKEEQNEYEQDETEYKMFQELYTMVDSMYQSTQFALMLDANSVNESTPEGFVSELTLDSYMDDMETSTILYFQYKEELGLENDVEALEIKEEQTEEEVGTTKEDESENNVPEKEIDYEALETEDKYLKGYSDVDLSNLDFSMVNQYDCEYHPVYESVEYYSGNISWQGRVPSSVTSHHGAHVYNPVKANFAEECLEKAMNYVYGPGSDKVNERLGNGSEILYVDFTAPCGCKIGDATFFLKTMEAQIHVLPDYQEKLDAGIECYFE